MTRHDDRSRLRDMLLHAQEAVDMACGRAREEIERNRMLQLALVRLVEIVGEAASRVGPETQNEFPQIPWREANGMRNRLIHGYDRVDLDVLWDTIRDDLPMLIRMLRDALNWENSDG